MCVKPYLSVATSELFNISARWCIWSFYYNRLSKIVFLEWTKIGTRLSRDLMLWNWSSLGKLPKHKIYYVEIHLTSFKALISAIIILDYELTPYQRQAICRMYRVHSRIGPDKEDWFICRATAVVPPNLIIFIWFSMATTRLVNWVLAIFTNTVRKYHIWSNEHPRLSFNFGSMGGGDNSKVELFREGRSLNIVQTR